MASRMIYPRCARPHPPSFLHSTSYLHSRLVYNTTARSDLSPLTDSHPFAMGILVPCAFLLFTILCIAIPGAAADPFEMPASFGFEHLADGEPPFTAAYGQMMDMAFDLVSRSATFILSQC